MGEVYSFLSCPWLSLWGIFNLSSARSWARVRSRWTTSSPRWPFSMSPFDIFWARRTMFWPCSTWAAASATMGSDSVDEITYSRWSGMTFATHRWPATMRFSTSIARILWGSNSSISRTLSAARNEFASYLPALRAASLFIARRMMPSRTTLSPASQRAHHLQGLAKSVKTSITKIPDNMDAQRSTKPHHKFHCAYDINTMLALSNQVVAFPDIDWQLCVWRLYVW